MTKYPEASRRAQRGRGKSRLGQAIARRGRPRRRAVHGIRQLFGGGRRGIRRQRRQGQGPPDGARARLRSRGEPRSDRGAGGRLGRLRALGGVLRRNHGRQGPRRGDELR